MIMKKTNFDGIKKTAEKNFRDEIYSSEENITFYEKAFSFLLITAVLTMMFGLAIIIKFI